MTSTSNINKYVFDSPVRVSNTASSTSSSTGSLIISGGVGVAGTLNIQNYIGSLGYMYNGAVTPSGATAISTNVEVMNNRIRTSRANANNCVSTWTARAVPVANQWLGLCWSPELGIFVATSITGAGNRVMTSPDGINWTSRSSASDNNWGGVCWSPELSIFVAVSDTGAGNRVMTSPDGITWTLRASALDTNGWRSVCWSPDLNLFAAVSTSGTGNRAMTSPDGIVWTIRTSAADSAWVDICWSPELGIFVAVASNAIMTSSDGIVWVLRTSPVNNNWRGVCWSPELGTFVGVANTGTGNRIMTSNDGITWTARSFATDINWYDVCWSPDLSIFVAVGESGTGNRIMSSSDGINWTSRTSPADNAWDCVCWSPELSIFVAISYSGSASRVMTSNIGLPNADSAVLASQSYFSVNNATGNVSILTNTSSSSSGTGALVVTGGVGIGGALYTGGTVGFAGVASITNSTASTSSSTGALVVTGGVGVGGAIYSSGINNISNTTQLLSTANAVSATSGALTLQGDLHLYNGTKNTIVFNAVSAGPPTFTNRSVGTKIVLWPGIGASTVDSAIGIDLTSVWYSVSDPFYHRFYSGTTLNTQIGNGAVNVPLTTQLATTANAVSATSGALTLQGDLHFYNSTRNAIVFPTPGVNPPTYTNRSAGTKIVLYPGITSSFADHAIGVEASAMWYSVIQTSHVHNFYSGTVLNAQIGNGSVTSTGYLRANYGGSLTNTQIRIAPSANGGQSSIQFNSTVSETGTWWVAGHNVGSVGNDAFAIWSSTLGASTILMYNTGTVHVPSAVQLATTSNTVSYLTGGLSVNGDFHLSNATKNTIVFNSAGQVAPSYTNRSIGTKIVLWPNVSASTADWAIGIESGATWYSVSTTSNFHKFYCGTVLNTQIGNNNVNIPVTTQLATNSNAINATSGSLTVNGDFHLYNGTKNTIVFNSVGAAPPSITNRSVGTKIVLYPDMGARSDFALGIDTNTMWYSVSDPTYAHKFYCGTALNATIGNGSVTSTGYLRANYGGTLSNTQLRVSPGTNGGESSITFYQNTSEGGSTWVVGHNTAATGSDTFGIFSGTRGTSNVFTCYNNGAVNVPSTIQLATNSNTVSVTSGALTVNGDMHFYNGTKNTIIFNAVSTSPPSYTNRSSGTRIVLWPSISASGADYAIGMDSGTLWYSVSSTANFHKFYCGTTLGTQITSTYMAVSGGLTINVSGIAPSAPTLKVSPSSNGAESSIGFYQNTAESGAVWTIGHNVGLVGSDTFSIRSSTFGNNITTFNNNGSVSIRSGTVGGDGRLNVQDFGGTAISFYYGANKVGSITCNTTNSAYNTSSDYRLKENLEDIDDALDVISKLKIHRFNFKGARENKVEGFLAHEIQEIIPHVITGEKDSVSSDTGEPEYQLIDHSKLVPLMMRAIQELSEEVARLRLEILELK